MNQRALFVGPMLVLTLVLSAAFSTAADRTAPAKLMSEDTCPSVSVAGSFTLHFNGVDYDFGAETSTLSYTFEWGGTPPALSDLTVGLCIELTNDDLISSSPQA